MLKYFYILNKTLSFVYFLGVKMAIDIAKCANCGSKLERNEDGELYCPHCGTKYLQKDEVTNNVFNHNEVKNYTLYGASADNVLRKSNAEEFLVRAIREFQEDNLDEAMEFCEKADDYDPLNFNTKLLEKIIRYYWRTKRDILSKLRLTSFLIKSAVEWVDAKYEKKSYELLHAITTDIETSCKTGTEYIESYLEVSLDKYSSQIKQEMGDALPILSELQSQTTDALNKISMLNNPQLNNLEQTLQYVYSCATKNSGIIENHMSQLQAEQDQQDWEKEQERLEKERQELERQRLKQKAERRAEIGEKAVASVGVIIGIIVVLAVIAALGGGIFMLARYIMFYIDENNFDSYFDIRIIESEYCETITPEITSYYNDVSGKSNYYSYWSVTYRERVDGFFGQLFVFTPATATVTYWETYDKTVYYYNFDREDYGTGLNGEYYYVYDRNDGTYIAEMASETIYYSDTEFFNEIVGKLTSFNYDSTIGALAYDLYSGINSGEYACEIGTTADENYNIWIHSNQGHRIGFCQETDEIMHAIHINDDGRFEYTATFSQDSEINLPDFSNFTQANS